MTEESEMQNTAFSQDRTAVENRSVETATSKQSSGQRRLWIHALTLALFCLIVAIIVIANMGQLAQAFPFIYKVPYSDKVGHFLLMGGMAFMLNLSLSGKRIKFGPLKFLLGSLIVLTVVTLEELSQGALSTRTMDLKDWLADIAGIFVFGQLAGLICIWTRQDGKQ
jgi:hypothetical protein